MLNIKKWKILKNIRTIKKNKIMKSADQEKLLIRQKKLEGHFR